jgi:SAM-dependent methyltransferase
MEGAVEAHYTGGGGQVAAVRAALERAGFDLAGLSASDLAPLDEFHSRGRVATLEVAGQLEVGPDDRLLDLGSGLGGPARTLAEEVGCSVTGVDLTPEFCEVAAALSEWTGLGDLTTFRVGDATALDLPDRSFDAVMTLHVAMNIPDKAGLYAEAYRVLKPGGRFVAYDILQGEGGPVRYPVPWAPDAGTSHLATPEIMRTLLTSAGFDLVAEVDSSDESIRWFEQVRERVEREGPPPITFQVFLGATFGQMAANQVENIMERRIRTVMFTCRRPV